MFDDGTPEARLLPDCPTDGITNLVYLNSNNNTSTSRATTTTSKTSLLASTSWDGCVRIYDTAKSSLELLHAMESGPLLSLAVTDTIDAVITGGMDGSIRLFELGALTPLLVGRHTEDINSDSNNVTVSCCSCVSALGGVSGSGSQLIASAGWHEKLHIWDTRQQDAVTILPLPGKAYTMDYDPNSNLLAVGTSNRRLCFIDIRYTTRGEKSIDNVSVLSDRESSLKYPLRCIRFFPNGTNSIAIGSIEGRVAIEYLDDIGRPFNSTSTGTTTNNNNNKKFAFKCHRQGDFVYPVNCIEFHPKFGTFATGGCDGVVVMWDGLNKKKLTSLPKFPTSIAALAFNYDGSELAIASSYTFEEGEREHPKDEIYIRTMLESECRPKLK